jgi:hypothetical protein
VVVLAGCGNDPSQPQPFEARVQTAEVAGENVAWYERGVGPPLLLMTGTGATMA